MLLFLKDTVDDEGTAQTVVAHMQMIHISAAARSRVR